MNGNERRSNKTKYITLWIHGFCLGFHINCGSGSSSNWPALYYNFLKWGESNKRFTQQLGNLLSFRGQLIISLSEQNNFRTETVVKLQHTLYPVHLSTQSCSIVDIVTRLGGGSLTNRSSTPCRVKTFLSSSDRPHLLWDTSSLVLSAYRELLLLR